MSGLSAVCSLMFFLFVCIVRQPSIEMNLSPFLFNYYTGLRLTLQCDVDIPGPQLLAVEADITITGPMGAILTGDSRVTVGEVVEETLGDNYFRAITFAALSSVLDNGVYSCVGTVRPATPSAFVTNGESTGTRELRVVGKSPRVFIYSVYTPQYHPCIALPFRPIVEC